MIRASSGWDDILDQGEVIRWLGGPIPDYSLNWERVLMAFFGIIFTGTTYSAQEMRIGQKRACKTDVGFERLEDARKVYRLMRDIQQGA